MYDGRGPYGNQSFVYVDNSDVIPSVQSKSGFEVCSPNVMYDV